MFIRKTFLLLAATILLGGVSAHAELKYGKYFGTIQMEGSTESIAVSLDAFTVQINDPAVYPALEVLVRANLGGYSSTEYVGYQYYDPTFNFEKGILQLDDAKENLTATLTVTNTDKEAILEGPVTHRLTNAKGNMKVVMKLFGVPPEMPSELMPVIQGEYGGKCGSDPALLQVETGRLVGAEVPGNAMPELSITGRLGYTNGPVCYPDEKNKFCALYPYSTGTFSPFTNRLKMQGKLGTIDCTRSADTLKCQVLGFSKKGSCVLTKKSSAPTEPIQIPAGISLNVTSDQQAPLPPPVPPGNEDLIDALNGNFYGFLHYENRDVYQLMEMGVIATTSTENPHIQNQVMIAPTLLLRLGSSWKSDPVASVVYPQRVFWMNEGFALQGMGDYFAVIDTWQVGYVKGVLYSGSFGRIGTFEMQKNVPPDVPSDMKLLPSLRTDYIGPIDAPKPIANAWQFSLETPNQILGPDQSGVPLLGQFSGPGVTGVFEGSSLDLNTGSLSMLIKDTEGDRLITGSIQSDGYLKLLWPVGPALGAPMKGYRSYTYGPQ